MCMCVCSWMGACVHTPMHIMVGVGSTFMKFTFLYSGEFYFSLEPKQKSRLLVKE